MQTPASSTTSPAAGAGLLPHQLTDSEAAAAAAAVAALRAGRSFAVGDPVEITKPGAQQGSRARVLDPCWKGLLKVEMTSGADAGQTKSYESHEVQAVAVPLPLPLPAQLASSQLTTSGTVAARAEL